MRITFICPNFDLSGGLRAIATYADRLAKRGHHVVAVAPKSRRPGLRDQARYVLRNKRLPESRNRFSYFDGSAAECRQLKHFGPVTDAEVPDADIVIATWWQTAEWVMGFSSEKGVKVHYMQDYEVWGGPRDRVDATCRYPIPKIIIARWVGEVLSKQFQIHDATLSPCSVDSSLFFASQRGKQAIPTVGFNYQTLPNKGCDIIFEAIRRTQIAVPELKVVSFGTSRIGKAIALPKSWEYQHRIPNEQLRDVYSRCDAWLFGTRIEGFGLPILEAMACRTPVIGTPAGAAPELLAGGGGILVKPEDPQNMADAIVRVSQMKESQWREMSDIAYATATRYTWDDATDIFEAALVRAIRKPSATQSRNK